MTEIKLFRANGEYITNIDLLKALENLNVYDCDILYLHSQLSFGIPNPEISKVNLIESIIDVLMSLNIPTLCFPTFTFSFCNGENYNVQTSKTKMGILNDSLRKHPDALRSIDPILSVGIVGKDEDLINNLSKHSIGKGSNYDKLYHRDNVKFLFLGPRIGDCFTYMHYLENLTQVPYRYNKAFTGKICNGELEYEDTYFLFVRYNGVIPNKGSYEYEEILLQKGLAEKIQYGHGYIACVGKEQATEVYLDLITKNQNFFISEPFLNSKKDTNFIVQNMTAL